MTRSSCAVALAACCLTGLAIGSVLRLQAHGATAAQPAVTPVVALQNGSFEERDGAEPRAWKTARWQGSADFAVDTAGHTGKSSVKISSVAGGDASWTQIVVVRPFARYRLSAWIRTENLVPGSSRGALVNLHGLSGQETQAISGTRDWTRVELTFDSEGNDAIQVNCLFGGWGRARGAAWFDDIQIEQISARELQPAVVIHPARTRAPMSKYIYGQFIEHLGRCIYGGIWAEIVEDRKFFHAVGDGSSPWKISGKPKSVTMSTREPYVGAHTPDIELVGNRQQGGIAQGGLAVFGGKKYTGYIVLAGDPDAGPVRVTLIWADGPHGRQTATINEVSGDFATRSISFTAGMTTDAARLEIVASGEGVLRIGTVSLMPSDNVEGFRADTLRLLRELNAPVYRWPGGNFVSGYNWRDGVGERDRRPPRKNPAWKGIEPNDVGIDEFMAFCRLVGAEPYIAVNSGLGDVDSAADEVDYVNGIATTPMGRIRARLGRANPYGCRFWSIGNEMYGDWQLGHMPIEKYQDKHNQFAQAMRVRDPSITLVGVGAVGPWSEGMLARCAGQMDLISEHFYCQERPGLLSHVLQIPRAIRRIAEAHRKYRQTIPALAGKDIRVALDEWNYWYGPHVYGELGTQYFLKDALGIAAGLNEFSRQSDIVFMANYAQTVNVIGAIKTSGTAAVLDTTGVILKLYRERFGTVPVEIAGAPEPLDVAATWRENPQRLVISVVNPTKAEQTLDLTIEGVALPATARVWRVAGTDERAMNQPGRPPQVRVEELASVPVSRRLAVPPMSASLYELAIEKK